MLKFFEKSESLVSPESDKLMLNLRFVIIAILLNAGVAIAQPPGTLQKTKSVRISPERLSASFAEVAKKVEPAVVNIDTKGKIPDVKIRGDNSDKKSNDFEDFVRRRFPPRPSYAVGSGFIVDKSGYILTNKHVIEDASRITVRLQTGEEFTATIIGADELTDIAVLKIDVGRDLPFLEFGDSKSIKVGDWVLAIGSPFGLARTVTAGIISRTKRDTPFASSFQQFIQTDAAINRGNSGGPLVNMKGEMIGVNSQIATSTGDFNGIGFALPSNETAYVYQQILKNGKVRRGYLGVLLDSVKKEFAEVYGLDSAKGAIITDIRDKKGAAAKAGIKKDDIILRVDGVEIKNHQDLIEKIAATAPDQNVTITLLREFGESLVRKTVSVKLGERPNQSIAGNNVRRKLPVRQKRHKFLPLGLTLVELTSKDAKENNFRGYEGVLIKRIDPASYIADVKSTQGINALSVGDLIQRVNRKKVTNLKEFNKLVKGLRKGSPVVLHILRFSRRGGGVIPSIVQFTVK